MDGTRETSQGKAPQLRPMQSAWSIESHALSALRRARELALHEQHPRILVTLTPVIEQLAPAVGQDKEGRLQRVYAACRVMRMQVHLALGETADAQTDALEGLRYLCANLGRSDCADHRWWWQQRLVAHEGSSQAFLADHQLAAAEWQLRGAKLSLRKLQGSSTTAVWRLPWARLSLLEGRIQQARGHYREAQDAWRAAQATLKSTDHQSVDSRLLEAEIIREAVCTRAEECGDWKTAYERLSECQELVADAPGVDEHRCRHARSQLDVAIAEVAYFADLEIESLLYAQNARILIADGLEMHPESEALSELLRRCDELLGILE